MLVSTLFGYALCVFPISITFLLFTCTVLAISISMSAISKLLNELFNDAVNEYLDMYYSKIVKTILYFGLNNKLKFLVGEMILLLYNCLYIGDFMKKIIIIGCPGSGKSYFSKKLRDLTGYPLYHLDNN